MQMKGRFYTKIAEFNIHTSNIIFLSNHKASNICVYGPICYKQAAHSFLSG